MATEKVVPQIKHVSGLWIYINGKNWKRPECLCSMEGTKTCSHEEICFFRYNDTVWVLNRKSFEKHDIHEVIREIPATIIVTRFPDENFVGKTLFELFEEQTAYGPDLLPL